MNFQSALFLACACLSASLSAAPLKVAILADDDTVKASLAGSGLQIVDSAALGSAEALIVATAKAPREQVEAFVERGGGLLVLGPGIGAGDWLKPLAGGSLGTESHHFTSRMMLFTLTDAHPVTRNACPFDLDDDTSYDLDLDDSLQILASAFTPKITTKKGEQRSKNAQPDQANVYDLQPQMWVRESAEGHRAFVLLPDAPATLRHASIRTFLLRALAWTCHRANADELCTPTDLATLRYPQGGARPAAETVRSFDLQPGFSASVVAHEPLITKPIAMQWDASGRLWIAETPEYPNGRRPLTAEPWKETGALVPGVYDRPARDRISILSDPGPDGTFTKKTVFHEGLELVTGFCLYGDGAIAVAEPDIVFIHGAGPQQRVEKLYEGFTPPDTHFVANHLFAAPDGWIYANTGSGPKAQSVAHSEVKANLSPGVFRFKPDGSAIQQIASKNGNAFGLDITSAGEIFCGQATSGNPVQHVVLPEAVLSRGKTGSAVSEESVIKGRKVVRADLPTRAPFAQIDVVGGFTAACASTVCENGSWPALYQGGVFCTEPILDIIHFEKLVPAGVTFTGEPVRTDAEWLRAHDFWFFPVDVEFGPDGAMYVPDFYCPIVAHNDTRGPLHGKSNASVRPDRDHYYGRIYRIQADAAPKAELPDLAHSDPAALVRAFTHPNKWVRFTAHRLLLGRPDAQTAVPALLAMAEKEAFAPARILALWALERLGQLPPAILQAALKSNDAGVRQAALLVIEALGAKNEVELAGSLDDPNPRVRLTSLRALASGSISSASAAALLAVLPKLDDDWSRSAAIAASSSNAGPVLEALLAAPGAPSGASLDLGVSLARRLALDSNPRAATEGARVIEKAAQASPEKAGLVRGILQVSRPSLVGSPAEEAAFRDALQRLANSSDLTIASSALPLAFESSPVPHSPTLQKRFEEVLAAMGDAKQPDAVRGAVVRGLIRAHGSDPRILPAVLALLGTKLSDPLLLEVISALVTTDDRSVGEPLARALPALSPTGQAAAFDALVRRADWANAVLDALGAKTLSPALLGPSRLSKLRLHSNAAVAQRAVQIINEIGAGTNPAKDQLIAKLQPEIESKPGSAANGKVLFTATCSVCHKLNGVGNEVGPVLDGIGVQGTYELLTHIIDPSRVVDDEHRTWNLTLKNGRFATGLIAHENLESLTLRLGAGVEQEIKIADIQSRQSSPLSLMPEGFEGLGADALRDVLAYLREGTSKFHALDLGHAFDANPAQDIYQSKDVKNDSLQPVKYGVVTVEGVPFTLPDPATTPTGGDVIVLRDGNRGTYASTMPQRVEIPVGFEVGNVHFLGGVAGWGGGPWMHQPAMKVTFEHADGKKEVHELSTGDVFIDYVSTDDVPGSKRIEGLTRRAHVRYFSLPVHHRSPMTKLILEGYDNGIAATTFAITCDNEPPKPERKP